MGLGYRINFVACAMLPCTVKWTLPFKMVETSSEWTDPLHYLWDIVLLVWKQYRCTLAPVMLHTEWQLSPCTWTVNTTLQQPDLYFATPLLTVCMWVLQHRSEWVLSSRTGMSPAKLYMTLVSALKAGVLLMYIAVHFVGMFVVCCYGGRVCLSNPHIRCVEHRWQLSEQANHTTNPRDYNSLHTLY